MRFNVGLLLERRPSISIKDARIQKVVWRLAGPYFSLRSSCDLHSHLLHNPLVLLNLAMEASIGLLQLLDLRDID